MGVCLTESQDELICEMIYLNNIESTIENKKKKLMIRLCNPELDVFRAHSAYIATQNEIEYLQEKGEAFQRFLKNLSEVDRKVFQGIIGFKNTFLVAEECGIDAKTVHARWYKVRKKFEDWKEEMQNKGRNYE